MRPKTASYLLIGSAAVLVALITALSSSVAGVPPLGVLLDPADGLYRNARHADRRASIPYTHIEGLVSEVHVYVSARGVPHIYGEHDLDVVRAYGYMVARDRLFQMDFLSRVASGRLASLVGGGAVEADRFLRRTGMEVGARLNASRIQEEDGDELAFITAFCDGANAFIDRLAESDYPFEYRLMGARPERCTILTPLRIAQFMTYDLSFQSDDPAYAIMRDRLSDEEYVDLFGTPHDLYVPIVPPASGGMSDRSMPNGASSGSVAARNRWLALHRALSGTPLEGFVEGKGSNNWAVGGSRSSTGFPILAGDMHLSLSLPAIWYEARLKGAEIDVYGVGVPGSPLPIQSFTPVLGWAFTNTGSDQIDHYRLTLSDDRRQYLHEGEWRNLISEVDTIYVNGGSVLIDTVLASHWGPVLMDDDEPLAIRWTAHVENRVLQAVIGMSRAKSFAEFDAALRDWGAPMQNILYADHDGTIAIRSTGRLPIRQRGDGAGVLDGSNEEGDWVGFIPYESLPHAINPPSGYLSSTNQNPVDGTYPYYLGHDWGPGFRSMRINRLLGAKTRHTPDDFASYQADVHVEQFALFFPFLDTLQGVDPLGSKLIALLREWDGAADVERPEPLVFHHFLSELRSLTWDEVAFVGGRTPSDAVLLRLLREHPESKWFDRPSTEEKENASDIVRMAIEGAGRQIIANHGQEVDGWRWGARNRVVFRHLTRSEALRSLWRGPFPFGGFEETLSPARGNPVIHSASWRVVLDFSTTPPTARGIYPGGQSGDPFSALYDAHIADYLAFRYYDLEMPARPEDHSEYASTIRFTFTPGP